jgi:hypothetical protein
MQSLIKSVLREGHFATNNCHKLIYPGSDSSYLIQVATPCVQPGTMVTSLSRLPYLHLPRYMCAFRSFGRTGPSLLGHFPMLLELSFGHLWASSEAARLFFPLFTSSSSCLFQCHPEWTQSPDRWIKPQKHSCFARGAVWQSLKHLALETVYSWGDESAPERKASTLPSYGDDLGLLVGW